MNVKRISNHHKCSRWLILINYNFNLERLPRLCCKYICCIFTVQQNTDCEKVFICVNLTLSLSDLKETSDVLFCLKRSF